MNIPPSGRDPQHSVAPPIMAHVQPNTLVLGAQAPWTTSVYWQPVHLQDAASANAFAQQFLAGFQRKQYTIEQLPPDLSLLFPPKRPTFPMLEDQNGNPVLSEWKKRNSEELDPMRDIPFLPAIISYAENLEVLMAYRRCGADWRDVAHRVSKNDNKTRAAARDSGELYEVSNGFNRKIERWRRLHGGFMDSYARFREGVPSSIIKAIIEGHDSRQPLTWEQMFFNSIWRVDAFNIVMLQQGNDQVAHRLMEPEEIPQNLVNMLRSLNSNVQIPNLADLFQRYPNLPRPTNFNQMPTLSGGMPLGTNAGQNHPAWSTFNSVTLPGTQTLLATTSQTHMALPASFTVAQHSAPPPPQSVPAMSFALQPTDRNDLAQADYNDDGSGHAITDLGLNQLHRAQNMLEQWGANGEQTLLQPVAEMNASHQISGLKRGRENEIDDQQPKHKQPRTGTFYVGSQLRHSTPFSYAAGSAPSASVSRLIDKPTPDTPL